MRVLFYHLLVIGIIVNDSNAEKIRKFPKNFVFGSASSAYQVEGAWNISGKSESIWDRFSHKKENTADGSNGDDATKSYEYYKRDVAALHQLGVDFYRFSIAWTRLLPSGFSNKISEDGLRYYNSLIDALLEKNIQPVVTIFHWDLPQSLQDLGGWTNPAIVDFFKDYARICFEKFGDRVKTWLTINEPNIFCRSGYEEGIYAPGTKASGFGYYSCMYNMVIAHGKAYHLYNRLFRSSQKGRVGFTISAANLLADDDEKPRKISSAKLAQEVQIGLFLNPIFSKEGDFPAIVKEIVADNSKKQGYSRSRLPEFTEREIESLKGASDFMGINHYTTYYTKYVEVPENETIINDFGIVYWQNDSWPVSGSGWLRFTPWGFREILKYLKESYRDPEIKIFENGWSTTTNTVYDDDRVEYYRGYLNSLLDAIEIDKVNVTAFTTWSLSDNFEWDAGYSEKFGLFAVDFNDPERKFSAKLSANYYASVVKSRSINSC